MAPRTATVSAAGLRGALAAASLRLPDATRAACIEYGAAASGLLDQCSACENRTMVAR